ncbi:hypothetical protein BD410DRAFT_794164 [Rickenella mellea]|uniref:Mucoidy inhibitor A n=1 Tax=Rickenella mellea TaxID=50990 RepID=A0A4Y7PQH1_9AGAM|nr:hypothetical protein BD410DRAFT_794164 [Rickenella mellea]
MSNVVHHDANLHDVDSVTVFQTNRAEVKRSIKVALKDGQNSVEVKNLPSYLDKDSIRVDGVGNAVIFDVIYHAPPPPDQNRHVGEFDEFHDRQMQLKDELQILEREEHVLKSYSKTLSGADTKSDQLEKFLDVYQSRQKNINVEVKKIKGELKQVEKELSDKRASINADDESVKLRGASVTIVVLGEGDGDAELSLMYVVSNASWTPHYDLRASIAHTEKTLSTVNLHYRASITQCTGENWSNVALKLSTASPLQGTTIPTLEPYWINEERPIFYDSRRYSRSPPRVVAIDRRRSRSRSPTRVIMGRARRSSSSSNERTRLKYRGAIINDNVGNEAPPPNFFAALPSVASDGAVSMTFTIPGLSSVPNDPMSNPQTHKVSVAELAFSSVDLEWITVPKEIPSVFLQCKVKNTNEYVLLHGQSNIFLNNNFVAKSTIPHVSPQETFSCSLGADPAVRVTYHPQSTKTKTKGNVLSAKLTSTTYEQRISIKNTRLTPIPRLIIKDQVPVSRDERVKVSVSEPKDLQTTNKTGVVSPSVRVKHGVTAQWASRDNDSESVANGGGDPNLGLIEWICQIQPNTNLDVNLAWEVTAPKGVKWTKT